MSRILVRTKSAQNLGSIIKTRNGPGRDYEFELVELDPLENLVTKRSVRSSSQKDDLARCATDEHPSNSEDIST